MHPALVKLVGMLLLIVQGLVAIAPGQVLCIPVQHCDTHEQGGHESSGHCHADRCANKFDGDHRKDHEHGPFSAVMHPDDECACHLHIQVPQSERVPNQPRGDTSEFRLAIVPLYVSVVVALDLELPLMPVARLKPPDFSVSDQVLALKATRLLI